jgi:hypothetical protein
VTVGSLFAPHPANLPTPKTQQFSRNYIAIRISWDSLVRRPVQRESEHRKMKSVLFLACLFTTALIAQPPPKTMIKMVVQLQSTELPADSFASKPKTLYRAGTQFCRTDEEPDAAHGIHGVLIVNEPDAWMVNLATNTAQHLVDSGPTSNCRMPIFASRLSELSEQDAKQLAELEFGYEMEFFKSKGATPQPGPVLQTKQTTVYKLNYGDSTVALFTFGTPERPLAVAWTRGEKHEIFWYSGYGQLDFDPTLFAKPEHVKIEEAK